MSITYGFYNSIGGDRPYSAEQISAIFDGLIIDGVYATLGTALMVTDSINMDVLVGIGRAWFDHTWTHVDAPYPVTIPESDLLLNRIDTIVLEIDHRVSVRSNIIKVVSGDLASSPVPPILTISEDLSQYPLADIYVGSGVSDILTANITNRVGTSDCPFVVGILETIDVDALLAQWDSAFTTWFNNAQAQFDASVIANQATFDQASADQANTFGIAQAQFDNDLIVNQASFDQSLIDQRSEFDVALADQDSEFTIWFNAAKDFLDANIAVTLQNEMDERGRMIIVGGSATAITATPSWIDTYVNMENLTFVASLSNSAAPTTININGLGAKPIYKPGTTTSPNIVAGKAYEIWYNTSGGCYFHKASAEGNAVAADVLAGKTFSNDNDAGIAGTMLTRNGDNTALAVSQSGGWLYLTPPNGYYDGDDRVRQYDPDFITGNIRGGVNLFGLVGKSSVVETVDATASAGAILSGSTAYVNGNKLTGTMLTRNSGSFIADTITKSVNNLIFGIPDAAYYADACQIYTTDNDWIESNIKKDVNMFGKVGTLETLSLPPNRPKTIFSPIYLADAGNSYNYLGGLYAGFYYLMFQGSSGTAAYKKVAEDGTSIVHNTFTETITRALTFPTRVIANNIAVMGCNYGAFGGLKLATNVMDTQVELSRSHYAIPQQCISDASKFVAYMRPPSYLFTELISVTMSASGLSLNYEIDAADEIVGAFERAGYLYIRLQDGRVARHILSSGAFNSWTRSATSVLETIHSLNMYVNKTSTYMYYFLNGSLVKLRMSDGVIVWSHSIGGGAETSLSLGVSDDEDRIYVSGYKTGLYVIDDNGVHVEKLAGLLGSTDSKIVMDVNDNNRIYTNLGYVSFNEIVG